MKKWKLIFNRQKQHLNWGALNAVKSHYFTYSFALNMQFVECMTWSVLEGCLMVTCNHYSVMPLGPSEILSKLLHTRFWSNQLTLNTEYNVPINLVFMQITLLTYKVTVCTINLKSFFSFIQRKLNNCRSLFRKL